GNAIDGPGPHSLELEVAGLPEGTVAVLVNSEGDPVPVGTAASDGTLRASHAVTGPAEGEAWWFAVLCPPGTTDRGTGETYHAVTAPIWLAAGPGELDAAGPTAVEPLSGDAQRSGRLPATGGSGSIAIGVVAALAALALAVLRRHGAQRSPV